MKRRSPRDYDARCRSRKFSVLHGPNGKCILFSSPASLEDGFLPLLIGKKKHPLRKSFARLGLTCSFAACMTLAVYTRLPNAYNATPVNGAICGKSLPSNLSFFLSFSPISLLFAVALSLSLVLTLVNALRARYASSFPVHLSCFMPISCIQDLYSSLLSLIVSHSFLLLLLVLAIFT